MSRALVTRRAGYALCRWPQRNHPGQLLLPQGASALLEAFLLTPLPEPPLWGRPAMDPDLRIARGGALAPAPCISPAHIPVFSPAFHLCRVSAAPLLQKRPSGPGTLWAWERLPIPLCDSGTLPNNVPQSLSHLSLFPHLFRKSTSQGLSNHTPGLEGQVSELMSGENDPRLMTKCDQCDPDPHPKFPHSAGATLAIVVLPPAKAAPGSTVTWS